MERLAEELKNIINEQDFCFTPIEMKTVEAALERLDNYEKAEEQGLLLRLPCKEVYESSGDYVYYIFDWQITECVNCGVTLSADGKLYIQLACDEHIFPYREPDPEHDDDPTDWCANNTDVPANEWGKTVFLSKAKAKDALTRMGREE